MRLNLASDTVKRRMNGYWTGNLAKWLKMLKGHLKYGITSKAGYSGFIEYGPDTWNQKRSCSR